MKTFDLFNDRDLKETRINLSLPKLKLHIPYLVNFKYGILSGFLMSASVYLLTRIGYAQITLLPLYTMPLLSAGVAMSIKEYGFRTGQSRLDYFDGLGAGYLTGTISVALFIVFMIRYLSTHPNVNYLFYTPYAAVTALFISGMAMVAISSLVAMQYFKNYKFKN